jgi:hypothetical protein
MLSETHPLTLLLAVAMILAPRPANSQLRPLDPLDWSLLEVPGGTFVVGAGVHGGQRASLAGTKGTLVEVGSFISTWSYERVAVRLAGTLLRLFDDHSVFTEPFAGTRPPNGRNRKDAGDFRLSTIVQLARADAPYQVAIRFGVRLPTTDNREGLDRDRTDFFSTLAARTRRGAWDLVAEVGMGINGTREVNNEQVDPLLLLAEVRYDAGWIDPFLILTAQHDTRANRDRRGTEDLGEGRLGVRIGHKRWITLTAIRGWTPFSPDFGVTASFGTRF